MKLIINTPGTYVSKVGECFQVKNDKIKQQYSARKVEQIIMTTRSALTTDAIELAIENNIDIVFLKSTGKPLARVWHSKLGSISTIRRKQLFLQDNAMGLELVKEWITQKMQNQISHLNKLSVNRRDNRKDIIKEAVEKINTQIKNINNIPKAKYIEQVRDTIQGYEGNASRIYFGVLSKLIPTEYKFSGRSKNPAKDEFNAMLNYGYGIMYSNVEKACILSGLDPYIGIMHTDNYNKKALVFDLIEMYRGYIDEIVFKLFSTKKVKKAFFDEVENGGFYLNQEGKKLLIGEYNEYLQKKIKYKGRNIEFQNIIQYDCHNIANRILKEEAV
ncbi:CRISPR-associated endonuclease Cas1 [Tepidibacter formicigenes]|jgi:CRISPR-associated protein Cas1|uniref:CRISPR-associated endonuclease Cas1 n=1 Tax=Tepidibacter formicigenes DSM 15518 TaxID=1123349 RepID=A0A1M6LN04_9FIRM|nr:CRISPR-associated endonuclease Cas1 [Tepidibacter formicigenes]SHJ72523.1 CRISPR-associated protein, Cas1 family [Tepidibacter formicigenes DSM 15518]